MSRSGIVSSPQIVDVIDLFETNAIYFPRQICASHQSRGNGQRRHVSILQQSQHPWTRLSPRDEKETSLAARGDGRRIYIPIRGSATTSPFNDSRVV